MPATVDVTLGRHLGWAGLKISAYELLWNDGLEMVPRPSRKSIVMIKLFTRTLCLLLPITLVSLPTPLVAKDLATVQAWIRDISQVGLDGNGHEHAMVATRKLQQADATALPLIVDALGKADQLAANWLRSCFETIADRTLKNGEDLPAVALEKQVRDITINPRGRRLAYEWLLKSDPALADRLLPGFLKDPNPVFRRDAVAQLLEQASVIPNQDEPERAREVYRLALTGAVDNDQVTQVVNALKELDETVDLQRHFGYLTNWQMIGPFENLDMKGFDVAYPPEKSLDVSEKYAGQLGEVTWQAITTDDDYGLIDIATQIENYKGSVMYAQAEFVSPVRQQVDARLSTPNAWKLWVNGKLVFAREEYHRGTKLDQFRVNVDLQPGSNHILLKLLQNEQTENWAQKYEFRLRFCDASGSAVLSGEL